MASAVYDPPHRGLYPTVPKKLILLERQPFVCVLLRLLAQKQSAGSLRNMLFNSYIFVLLFLPLVVTGWFTLNHFKKFTIANCFLLGMSLWFYGWFNPKYLPIILISILLNYFLSRVLLVQETAAIRKLVLLCGLALNLGCLFYYKYYDFFINNINAVFKTDFVLHRLVLPLGISFFTFQQLAFVIDSYKKETPKYDFLSYALFVTYFPQLIAGPIVNHDELVPQFQDMRRRNINWENLARGYYLFVLGLSKKVLLADVFGNAVNWGYSNLDGLSASSTILIVLGYTVQIYFDFSGYCDMAIGIGRMMNIELPVNFNSPYKAITISEFWNRWHMTLTRFFTRYVYIPLGGNRKGNKRTYLNTMIVFLLSGLWHGANWTFVLWGGIHGAAVVLNKAFKESIAKIPRILSWMITFAFVNIAWVLFRAESFGDALEVFHNLSTLTFCGFRTELLNQFKTPLLNFLGIKLGFSSMAFGNLYYALFYFLIAFVLICFHRNAKECSERETVGTGSAVLTAVLMALCIISFSGISTFLYFNF